MVLHFEIKQLSRDSAGATRNAESTMAPKIYAASEYYQWNKTLKIKSILNQPQFSAHSTGSVRYLKGIYNRLPLIKGFDG